MLTFLTNHDSSEAREFAAGFTDPQAAWDTCERGDWMLWVAGKLSGNRESAARQKLVRVATECARLAPPIQGSVVLETDRVRSLDLCERWARGDEGVSLEDVRAARRIVPFGGSADTAVVDVAFAVYADASGVIDRDTYGIASADNAAGAAAYRAAVSYAGHVSGYPVVHPDDANLKMVLKEAADIVRWHYPTVPA
jgi:hypothetical protein